MAKLRNRFLSGLGLIFLVAFVSYYVQFPGLVSSSGIEPAGRIFPRAFPALYKHWFYDMIDSKEMWVAVDVLCEAACILGIFLSALAAFGIIHHGILFFGMTMLYYFLVQLGGTFYSFQWDTLLLETGWVVSICYAPWSRLLSFDSESNEVSNWPLRFLLFKLMFMSGVVKIQADCPTWNHLTALEYHFATQCLPGPLAWFAHQMHPLLLRIGVAITFLIEIQSSFLLIFFRPKFRQVGAWLQIILQVLILATGNYNFFNALTLLLCLPCLEAPNRRTFEEDGINRRSAKGREVRSFDLPVCFVFLAWCFGTMFTVKTQDGTDGQVSITLAWTQTFCNRVIDRTIPLVIGVVFVTLLYSLRRIAGMKKGRLGALVHLVVCLLCLGMSSVPFMNLTPGLNNDSWPMLPTRLFVEPWRHIQPYHFSNGYGLFRRMTGVGDSRRKGDEKGWGGLPPSVVERPEIILEGREASTGIVRQLNFRWKPGDVSKRPKQVAPYQPRLDWQMWFAGLGNYQHNPWLVHLIYKLLQGCEPVVDLIDESKIANGDDVMEHISAVLYTFDFTRVSSTDWWKRSPIREYLPALSLDNPSLKSFLSSQGYKEDMCFHHRDKCSLLHAKHSKLGCTLFARFREMF